MELIELEDRKRIEEFLRRRAALHVYALADLDDRFWPQTRWYGLAVDGRLAAVAFEFKALDPPVLYAVCPPDDPATRELLTALHDRLPPAFWADVGPGIADCLVPAFVPGASRTSYKMALACGDLIGTGTAQRCERLGPSDITEVGEFYRRDAYLPGEEVGRYFDPYMLELGPFFGVRAAGRLVAAGGFHVLSSERGVAALGNIATAPDHRGRGYARSITVALCQAALEVVDLVGLNVAIDNPAAAGLYTRVGFQPVGTFVEQFFTRNAAPR